MTPREREIAQRLWERFGMVYLGVPEIMAFRNIKCVSAAHAYMHQKGFPLCIREKGCSKNLQVQYENYAVWIVRRDSEAMKELEAMDEKTRRARK
jgi:hypothetical protein